MDREKDKALRGLCFIGLLNEKFLPSHVGKKLYKVINGHIRKKHQNGSINFKELVDYEKLLATKLQPANVPPYTLWVRRTQAE